MQTIKILFGDNFSSVIIAFIILIIVLCFRKEIKKLVDWIISFKRIAKTDSGYSIEGQTKPEELKKSQKNEVDIKIYTDVKSDILTEKIKEEKNQVKENWIEASSQGKFDLALSILNKQIEEANSSTDILKFNSYKGDVIFTKNREEGIKYFEELISSNPNVSKVYEWYGLSCYWNSHYEECLEIIERGFNSVENRTYLYTIKADCLYSMGKVDDTLNSLLSAIENNQTCPSHYKKLCKVYKDKDDKKSVFNWFKKGLFKYPNDKELIRDFATFLKEENRHEEALLKYEDLVRLEPTNATYHCLLGNAYLYNNDLNDKALESYKKANELAEGKESWILANIGNIYNNRGFYTKAIEYLKKAIEIEPDSEYNHNRLSSALKNQKNEDNKRDEIIKNARMSLLKSDVEDLS